MDTLFDFFGCNHWKLKLLQNKGSSLQGYLGFGRRKPAAVLESRTVLSLQDTRGGSHHISAPGCNLLHPSESQAGVSTFLVVAPS